MSSIFKSANCQKMTDKVTQWVVLKIFLKDRGTTDLDFTLYYRKTFVIAEFFEMLLVRVSLLCIVNVNFSAECTVGSPSHNVTVMPYELLLKSIKSKSLLCATRGVQEVNPSRFRFTTFIRISNTYYIFVNWFFSRIDIAHFVEFKLLIESAVFDCLDWHMSNWDNTWFNQAS